MVRGEVECLIEITVTVVNIDWIISYVISSCQQFDKYSLTFVDSSSFWVLVGTDAKASAIADGNGCGYADGGDK